MGYAERNNHKSEWNKKRMGRIDLPASTQTTQKENFKQVLISPVGNEPVVFEFSLKKLWEILCRRFKKPRPSPALTS